MAQPSGQVLLDSGKPNYAATSFWYCDGTNLWDAKAGSTLVKTGTAGTAVEGGVNVVLGNGTTYYALASSITLTGAFTLFFKARTATNGSTASMITGNRSGTANYVWLASDAGNMQVRASGTTQSYTSTNSATMAHFAVVRNASNVLSVYKNGTLTQSKTLSGTLTLTHILSGHSTASLNLNGALEFMHVIAGVELNATDVSSYYADPYQDLAAASGSDATFTGTTVTATTSLVTGSFEGGSSGSITLTSPTAYQSRQRDLVTNTATMSVTGTYTGTPTSLEYRFNGGSWSTLVASPSGGTFSTSVTLPTGQGLFEVRFSNNVSITTSSEYVTVGDGYIVAGQSNHAGRASAVVAPVFTNFVVTKLRRNGLWKHLTEATTGSETFDEGTGAQASYFGALSNRLQSVGVPVFFAPCAEGSTSINDWARYDPDPTNPYFLYGDMRVADQRMGGHRAVLWLQGETDAANGMAQATYETKLNDLVNDWNTDTGKKFFVIQIVRWSSSIYGQIDAIRAAQAAVAASNTNVVGIVDGNVWQSANDVHYTTSTHINALADVVYSGMLPAFYESGVTFSGVTFTSNASLVGGTWSLVQSASFPGNTWTATTGFITGIFSDGTAIPPSAMNDMLYVFLGGNGSLNDRERAWLLSNVGASNLSNNDLWYVYLRSQGYTGSVQEMKRAFFETII